MERQGRLDGIDFWRGYVLCMIFVDHMPGNVFENVTPRNFGFSDAAEAFVFLSGLSIALAYGGRFAIGERWRTLRRIAGRVAKLYGAHIGLSAVALAIFFSGAALAGRPGLVEVHGRDLFVENPGLGLLGLVSLGHQLGYFNILPLYMILIACVPALLLLAAVDWRLMLAISALLYALARLYHWNLPNWPAPGAWFFNPLAWQFLFAIGVAIGLNVRDGPVPSSRSLALAAALIVAASALLVTHGFWSSSAAFWREAWELARAKLDLDKSQLGLGRLVHFLSVAYLAYVLGLAARLRSLPVYRVLALLGRNSLWVFVSLSLFSAVWQVLIAAVDRAIWLDATFAGAGFAVLYGVARAIDSAEARRAPPDRVRFAVSRAPAAPFNLPLREAPN
jgi:hypothetical protein